MFLAWPLQKFLDLHSSSEGRCTGSMSTKNRTYAYSRGEQARNTITLRRFLRRLKIVRTMFQVFGGLSLCLILMKVNTMAFPEYQHWPNSFRPPPCSLATDK